MSSHKPIRWAVGVTTVPERKLELLPRTLASLKAGGWDNPRLFVDGAGPAEAAECRDRHGLEVTARPPPRLGAWGNWILALCELYVRDPGAHRYALFQDDLLCLLNLRGYLDRCCFPAKGYWNLYSAFENEALIVGKQGWLEGSVLSRADDPRRLQRGRGALGLVFSREGVQLLLSSREVASRPAAGERGTRLIDGGVVNAMNAAGWREHVHAPTLVCHLGGPDQGQRSSIPRLTGQPRYLAALSWQGETDALALLNNGTALQHP